MFLALKSVILKRCCKHIFHWTNLLFGWLGHRKMSFYLPSSHEKGSEVVYFLLRYSMLEADLKKNTQPTALLSMIRQENIVRTRETY